MSIIKEKRIEMELSRKQLAKRLDVPEQTIVRWEAGQLPTLLDVPNIYRVMKIPFNKLVEDYKGERK